jgi:outer membrane protein
MMRKTFAHVVLGLSAAITPYVAAEDLLDVYSLARENDPTYQAGVHQHSASSEVYYQSRASLLPTVDILLMHSETTQDIVSSDNEVFQKGSDDFPTDRYELNLTQSVYSYTNWKNFGKAKEDIKRVDAELDAVEQDLLLRVAERYFAALAVQEDYISIESEKLSVEHHLKLVKAKRKSGQARQTDVLDAQARYMQTLSRELEIRSRFKDALEMLREMTGQAPGTLKLLGELPLIAPNPADPEAWFAQAKEYNPEIKVRKFATNAAEQEVKVRKGGHYPTVDLEVSYSSETKEGTVFGGGSEIDETIFAINVNVPVYSGGSVSSRVREAVQLHNRAKDELELEYRAVQRQTFSTYDGVLTDISKVQALRKSVEAYEAGVNAKTIGYESGLTNSLTVLDAERDLFFARSEYARARYGYILNQLRLKRAVGVLTLDAIKEINDFLTGEELKVSFRAPAVPLI